MAEEICDKAGVRIEVVTAVGLDSFGKELRVQRVRIQLPAGTEVQPLPTQTVKLPPATFA